ncbi:MAG: hypothetical protein U9R08_03700 [Nanoarchaeota archaeon]|nr:hypothetical protein [Nanoarchaeota archaeon]
MKLNKNIIIIGILAIIVILTALLYTGTFSIIGGTIISLDEVELKSSIPYLNGPAWVMTIVQGGLSQSAYGTVTSEDIADKTGSETTQRDLTINVRYDNQECVYPITRNTEAQEIIKLDVCAWNCLTGDFNNKNWWYNQIAERCGVSVLDVEGPSRKVGLTRCVGTYVVERNGVGFFDRADIRTKATININADGSTDSISIDSEESNQGMGRYTYAIYNGNYDLGKSCPYSTETPYTAMYDGQWSIISKDRYEDFANAYKAWTPTGINQFSYNRNSYDYSEQGIKEFVRDINADSNYAKTRQTFGTIDEKSSLNNAVIRKDIEYPLQNPSITLFVQADKLGIYTPKPDLKIINGESECFKTGDKGEIIVTVKNIGTEAGTWNAYGKCGDKFEVTRSIQFSLEANEEDSVSLELSSDVSQKEIGECEITFETAGEEEKIKIATCADPLQVCQKNRKYCSEIGGLAVIKQCNNEGTNTSVIKTCGVDQYCEPNNGNPVCKNNKGGENSGNGEQFNKPLLIAAIIIAIIGGVMTLAYLSKTKLKDWQKGIIVVFVVVSLFLIIPMIVKWIMNLFSI